MPPPLTLEDYQLEARKTAIYPDLNHNLIYPTLGLAGEAGEVAEKVKKIIRDDNGVITAEKKIELIKELGDVLWYIANISSEIKTSLEEIAKNNLEKIHHRQKHDLIHGSGDNR